MYGQIDDANLVSDGYQIQYSKLRKYMYSGPKVSKDATPTDTENYAAYVFMNFFSMELHFSIGFKFLSANGASYFYILFKIEHED